MPYGWTFATYERLARMRERYRRGEYLDDSGAYKLRFARWLYEHDYINEGLEVRRG